MTSLAVAVVQAVHLGKYVTLTPLFIADHVTPHSSGMYSLQHAYIHWYSSIQISTTLTNRPL